MSGTRSAQKVFGCAVDDFAKPPVDEKEPARRARIE